MLKKLIAFDLKRTRPVMLALIAITVLVEIIGEITHGLIQKMYFAQASFSEEGFMSIDTKGLPLLYFKLNDWATLFILILPALATLAAIYMIRYYYKTLYSEQGYLSFTLPASITKVVSSKMIVVFIWAVVYVISALPAIFIGEELVSKLYDPFYEPATSSSFLSILYFIFVLLMEALSQIMALFFCMSLGQLSSKHKLRNTVLSYMGIGMVSLIIFYNNFLANIDDGDFFGILCFENFIISLAFIVIFYLVTIEVMNKKLNLE